MARVYTAVAIQYYMSDHWTDLAAVKCTPGENSSWNQLEFPTGPNCFQLVPTVFNWFQLVFYWFQLFQLDTDHFDIVVTSNWSFMLSSWDFHLVPTVFNWSQLVPTVFNWSQLFSTGLSITGLYRPTVPTGYESLLSGPLCNPDGLSHCMVSTVRNVF